MIHSALWLTWVRSHHFPTCIICMLLNFKSQFLTATGCSENCLGICNTNAKSCFALWTPRWMLTLCIRAVPWTLQWCWDWQTLAVQYPGPPQGYWCSALKVAPGTLAYIFLNFPSCQLLCIIFCCCLFWFGVISGYSASCCEWIVVCAGMSCAGGRHEWQELWRHIEHN